MGKQSLPMPPSRSRERAPTSTPRVHNPDKLLHDQINGVDSGRVGLVVRERERHHFEPARVAANPGCTPGVPLRAKRQRRVVRRQAQARRQFARPRLRPSAGSRRVKAEDNTLGPVATARRRRERTRATSAGWRGRERHESGADHHVNVGQGSAPSGFDPRPEAGSRRTCRVRQSARGEGRGPSSPAEAAEVP